MNKNNATLRDFLLLHFIVFLWGFTAILGKLISLPSPVLVWYRLLFAIVGFWIWIRIKKIPYSFSGSKKILFIGILIALHWITFFESIKQTNVSITLIALASAPVFSAIVEPIAFRRKISIIEFIAALAALGVIIFIFHKGIQKHTPFMWGIFSAFLASLFTVLNGQLVQQYHASFIAWVELFGAFLVISAYLFVTYTFFSNHAFPFPSVSDLLYLSILGWICTSFAFAASVQVMKKISPFTVMLTVNLEPVYGILLAFLIFSESEQMNASFYIGAAILFFIILLFSFLKTRPLYKPVSEKPPVA